MGAYVTCIAFLTLPGIARRTSVSFRAGCACVSLFPCVSSCSYDPGVAFLTSVTLNTSVPWNIGGGTSITLQPSVTFNALCACISLNAGIPLETGIALRPLTGVPLGACVSLLSYISRIALGTSKTSITLQALSGIASQTRISGKALFSGISLLSCPSVPGKSCVSLCSRVALNPRGSCVTFQARTSIALVSGVTRRPRNTCVALQPCPTSVPLKAGVPLHSLSPGISPQPLDSGVAGCALLPGVALLSRRAFANSGIPLDPGVPLEAGVTRRTRGARRPLLAGLNYGRDFFGDYHYSVSHITPS